MIPLAPNVLILSKLVLGGLLLVLTFVMAAIDCRSMILPNRLNVLVAVGGCCQTILLGRPAYLDAALGGLLGFAVLSVVATLFRHARGIDGLGFGDQKFSAAAGLWIGWQQIAPMLLIASVSALLFVFVRSMRGERLDRSERIPFGPFLGLATITCWLAALASGT
jgi:leader peptidase (prepilin peptidase)/N-methyltransferase